MEPKGSSRREFLTGEAARRELLQAGQRLGDALLPPSADIPSAQATVRLETRAMACGWCVIFNPGPPEQIMVGSDALNLIHDVESTLTIYREDSAVSALNRRAVEETCSVEQTLLELLKICRELWLDTGGAFDAAAGRLIDLWRDCRHRGRIPIEAEIADALGRSGFSHVELDERVLGVRFTAPLKLDFAAIGKGYAIDRVAGYLQEHGIDDFLVHGGQSSLFAGGEHAGQGGWPVGIRNPLFTDRPYATILLHDEALSSSGSNIQYFRHEGRRYGHILDPRSGWPAEGLLSVTVVTSDATRADALSTALYVMGLDKAQRYCDDHPEVGAILIPSPDRGRELAPVLRNIPAERLFLHDPLLENPEAGPTRSDDR